MQFIYLKKNQQTLDIICEYFRKIFFPKRIRIFLQLIQYLLLFTL